MKKILPILFLLLMLSATCSATSWYWIGKDYKGAQWFIDNDSVEKDFYHATVWTKINCENGERQINRISFDHLNKKMAFVTIILYDADGNMTDMFEVPRLEYHSFPPGSMANNLFNSIWSD